MPQSPIDPTAGPRLAPRGRGVTMDEHYTTFDPGFVYVDSGTIAAVTDPGHPAPDGFEQVAVTGVFGLLLSNLDSSEREPSPPCRSRAHVRLAGHDMTND